MALTDSLVIALGHALDSSAIAARHRCPNSGAILHPFV